MSNQKNGNFLSASSSGHSGKSHCGGDQDRDKDRQKIEHRVTSNPKPSLKHLRGYFGSGAKKVATWASGPQRRVLWRCPGDRSAPLLGRLELFRAFDLG
jgi:hypothetical protein